MDSNFWKNKKVFILGAGGVAPSIILALKKMKASKIIVSNRTKTKAEEKKIAKDISRRKMSAGYNKKP